MKAMRYIALVCLAAMLLCGASCARKTSEPDPLPPPPPMAIAAAEPADEPEPDPVPAADYASMTALEAYAAAKGGDYAALAEGLDAEKYTAVVYYIYGEALEEYRAAGGDITARLYEALDHVIVTDLYEGDEYITDAGSYVGFTDASGNDIGFTFDFGYLSINGQLYEVAGGDGLQAVMDEIQEAAE